jgi:hypothetical protein
METGIYIKFSFQTEVNKQSDISRVLMKVRIKPSGEAKKKKKQEHNFQKSIVTAHKRDSTTVFVLCLFIPHLRLYQMNRNKFTKKGYKIMSGEMLKKKCMHMGMIGHHMWRPCLFLSGKNSLQPQMISLMNLFMQKRYTGKENLQDKSLLTFSCTKFSSRKF